MTTLGPSTTPGTYEFQVLDLLHDPTAVRWTIPQIDQYINQARTQLVIDRGCLRSLQSSYLTGGQESYVFGQVTGAVVLTAGTGYVNPVVAFSGGGGSGVAATLSQSGGAVNTITFSNFGSGYSSPPVATVTDTGGGTGCTLGVGILSIYTYDVLALNPLWGNQRYSLDWFPWRRFTVMYRPYTAASYQRQPAAWAVYGDTQIFVGPTPDQSYPIEFDSVILPTALLTGDTTTQDPIPPLSQAPIQYYAAGIAKNNSQSFGEAQSFFTQYQKKLTEVGTAYVGRVQRAYGGS